MVVEVLLNFLQLGFGGGIVFSDFLYAIARCVVVFLVSRSPFELIDRGISVVGFGHYSEISGYHQSFVHETAVVSAVINEIPSEKIGKLIGAPVPGTMTAVWWENQIDPSIVFGIPQVGCMDMRGQYAENHQLSPDIEVYNTPEKALAGEDQQLEAAVQEMLKTIGEKK